MALFVRGKRSGNSSSNNSIIVIIVTIVTTTMTKSILNSSNNSQSYDVDAFAFFLFLFVSFFLVLFLFLFFFLMLLCKDETMLYLVLTDVIKNTPSACKRDNSTNAFDGIEMALECDHLNSSVNGGNLFIGRTLSNVALISLPVVNVKDASPNIPSSSPSASIGDVPTVQIAVLTAVSITRVEVLMLVIMTIVQQYE